MLACSVGFQDTYWRWTLLTRADSGGMVICEHFDSPRTRDPDYVSLPRFCNALESALLIQLTLEMSITFEFPPVSTGCPTTPDTRIFGQVPGPSLDQALRKFPDVQFML